VLALTEMMIRLRRVKIWWTSVK